MRIQVDITKADVKKGERGNYYACPVALALNRALRSTPANLGIVGATFVSYVVGGDLRKVSLPKQVVDFIDKIDQKKITKDSRGFEPFSFTLNLRMK